MVYQHKKNDAHEIDVEAYAFLVKRIATHMIARMPSSVQVDDLIQAGMVGLLEAAAKYDGSKGASFETYAGIRIRGAIVDEIRRGDWAPRSVHRNTRLVSKAMATVESRTGRDAKDSDVANELGMSMDEYHSIIKDSASTRLFSYEETFESDEHEFEVTQGSSVFDTPAEQVHKSALLADLSSAIKTLPERERLVLSLYYEQEMNLKEIGLVMEVSESRVSQIHSQAALRLRSRMQSWQS